MKKILLFLLIIFIFSCAKPSLAQLPNPNLKYFGYYLYHPYGNQENNRQTFLDDINSLGNTNIVYIGLGVPQEARIRLTKLREYKIKAIVAVGNMYGNLDKYENWYSQFKDIINEFDDVVYGFLSDEPFWGYKVDRTIFRTVTKRMRTDFPTKAIMANEAWPLLFPGDKAAVDKGGLVTSSDIEFLTDYSFDYYVDPSSANYQKVYQYLKKIAPSKKIWLIPKGHIDPNDKINGSITDAEYQIFIKNMKYWFEMAKNDSNVVGLLTWRYPRGYDITVGKAESKMMFIEDLINPIYSLTYNPAVRQQQISIGKSILGNVSIGGDFNKDGKVDLSDFGVWKIDYLAGRKTLVDFGLWKVGYLK